MAMIERDIAMIDELRSAKAETFAAIIDLVCAGYGHAVRSAVVDLGAWGEDPPALRALRALRPRDHPGQEVLRYRSGRLSTNASVVSRPHGYTCGSC